MFLLHIHLTLKLHVLSNIFQISNFRFSLEYIARGDTYHSTKWKQESVLRQTTSLEVTLIRYWNDIEKATWRTHRYFIDFGSRIDVEISTSNWCHLFYADSPFITDKISTNFRSRNSMSNRCAHWVLGQIGMYALVFVS